MAKKTDDTVPLIPRQVLFGNPERFSPRISPDGRKLAWIAPDDGVLNVFVADATDINPGTIKAAVPVTNDRQRGIRAFFWAHDNRHLVYLQDAGGDENWRLYAVDLIDGGVRDMTPFDDVQAQVVEVNKQFPERILVGLNKDNPQLHDVYSLDLASGELTKVADNPGFVGWVVDMEMNVRAGIAPTPEGGSKIVVRESVDEPWQVLLEVPPDDALTTAPVAFSADGRRLLTQSSVDVDAGRLMWIDTATGDYEVVVEDPQYDVHSVRLNPDTRNVQIVTFLREREEMVVLDVALEADIETLKKFHAGDLAILNRSDDDNIWLVGYTLDNGPVRYAAWNRATQEATSLFDHQPALLEYPLANMEPFTFATTDGLVIYGYLTFPLDVERVNLPTVLLVHGGPWHRDVWGYNAEAQWLANRGYLVIQVNFRGSTGYGKEFVNIANKQWGGTMHADLLDAVQWAVDRRYADPERVAIMGGSYGGYAALVGATFTPDAFRCAVDIVGPSNLITLIESIPPYWAPMIAQFHTRVGNPETEADFLWERSPLSKVDQIKIPLLIAQGANDPRVKQAESEQIVAAMKEKGIEHEYLLFPDEGHGFAQPENRLRFYAAAENFLARHLGGRAQPE
ncbi:MAG TPA: S9 family peptidase [Acidimicrobiales bacterium]|nr:S9 family peptidase [Acidimicrobiales bacterium]